MKTAYRLRILVGLAGIAAVTALIWLAGPLVSFADSHPLEDQVTRIVAITGVLGLAACVAALGYLHRRLGAERIASGMGADDSDEPVLAERMKEALAKLRNLRGGKASYLYDLPWYLLIGPPGSGKTTALVNSGLEFPLAKGMVPDKLKGVGGTRYCDWWFTADAVLIDTAGRYTTQDSDTRFDQRSWLAFLDLLHRNRPRQPINGVLVAISLEDLLTLPEDEIAAHARAIRARLAELHARLELDFPVYALFTKADLVSGFMEYFGGLDEKGRAQVFGTTFQTMDKTRSMLGEVPAEFDSLVERLTRGLEERLADERDATSRVLLFGFPAQMAALRSQLSSFLAQVFEPTQKRTGAALRGFYFTSGTQLGTPIDQLLGALTKGFGAQAVGTPAFSGQGKSFFLTDLVKKVVIGEAGWVSTSRRRRLARLAALAGLLVAAPLLVGAWWTSYAGTSQRIDRSEQAAAEYARIAAPIGRSDTVRDRDLRKILPALHALHDLPGGVADPEPPRQRLEGFGLGQDERLRSAARTAYDRGLERLLRPRLLLRLEEQLEAKTGDPSLRFGALRAYLMLGGLLTADRQFLINWMESDWSENLYPGARNGDGRKELVDHLVAMLDLDSGLVPTVSLNGPLIDKTRAELAQIDVAERAYRLLAERAKASLRDDWSAARNGGAGTLVVFDDAIETIKVPYFYTKAGFVRAYAERLDGIEAEMARDRRVLGPAGEEPAVAAQYDRLRQDLDKLYAKSFIAAWQDAIARLSIRRLTVERPAYPLMAAAAAATSPIARLLESIREATTLPQGTLSTTLGRGVPSVAAADPAASAAEPDPTPAQQIDAALAPYHRLVEGSPGRRPIDLVLARLGRIRMDLTRLAAAGDADSTLASKVTSEARLLATDTQSLPQPFAKMMATTAAEIDGEVASASVAGAVESLRDTITFPCQQKITSRYPFARDADQEVTLDDFTRMFGPEGRIAQFVSEHLDHATDRSGPTWKWREGSPLAKLFAPTTLADLQRAAEIRQGFFAAGRKTPGFSVNVTPPSDSKARLEIDGSVVKSERRVASAATVRWPGESEAHRAALVAAASDGAPAVIERTGQWALFRLLDAGRLSSDATRATFNVGGAPLQYRFNSAGSVNPLNLTKLRSFRCPSGA
jgi:type VI secretion system protein ImpL